MVTSVNDASESQADFKDVCTRFSQIKWHDSKLLGFGLLKRPEPQTYDLTLNVRLREGRLALLDRSVIFRKCRIVLINLDVLGVGLCSGDISDAVCFTDAAAFERKVRDRVASFDLPQDLNPIEECVGFHIQMIHPGGEIYVIAKSFELSG